jgi:hypothetical protein
MAPVFVQLSLDPVSTVQFDRSVLDVFHGLQQLPADATSVFLGIIIGHLPETFGVPVNYAATSLRSWFIDAIAMTHLNVEPSDTTTSNVGAILALVQALRGIACPVAAALFDGNVKKLMEIGSILRFSTSSSKGRLQKFYDVDFRPSDITVFTYSDRKDTLPHISNYKMSPRVVNTVVNQVHASHLLRFLEDIARANMVFLHQQATCLGLNQTCAKLQELREVHPLFNGKKWNDTTVHQKMLCMPRIEHMDAVAVVQADPRGGWGLFATVDVSPNGFSPRSGSGSS